MVVIGLIAAFFLFFGAGTLMRELRSQPKPQSQLFPSDAESAAVA